MKSILDYNVAFPEVAATSGAEPTLRQLVYKYYDHNISDEKLRLKYAREYCEEIARREMAMLHQAKLDET
jgi:hypothetical protein